MRFMEGEELMELWKKQNIEFFDKTEYCQQMYFYTRKMGIGPSAVQEYYAKIFICVFSSTKQLCENWEKIHYNIAFYIQSKDETMIEKSNYYICLFTKEEIDDEVKSSIQSNSFCAKKYVFTEEVMDEAHLVETVENRIFHLELQRNNYDGYKIEQIELKNFRIYDGDFKINLCNQEGNPAAFILIYASNGHGKTSIFDGIEYALKGEISRITDLEKVNKNEPIRGAVYHNRKCKDMKASVTIQLNKNKRICREVKDIKDDKNDVGRKTIKKENGKEIVGDSLERWNQLILPHDKIDSFISARSPVEQYNEWTKSTPELKDLRDKFIELHTKIKAKRLDISKREEELKNCREQLGELQRSKTVVSNLEILCKEYNNISNEDEYLFFEAGHSDVSSYDLFRNQVEQKIRIINENILPSYDKKMEEGIKVQAGNIKDAESLECEINSVQAAIKKCNYKIECKTKYDFNLKRIDKISLELNDTRKKKLPIEEICNYGLERAEDGRKRYDSIKQEIEANEETIRYFDEELQKNDNLRENLKVAEASLMSVVSLTEANTNLQKINVLAKAIKEKADCIQRIKLEISQYGRKLSDNISTINALNEAILPPELKQLNLVKMTGIGLVLSNDGFDKLKVMKERLLDAEKELSFRRAMLEQRNSVSDGVKELCKSGMDFLMANRDQIKCPLCKTQFASWEELVSRVSVGEEDYGTQERIEIQNILAKIEQLDKEYTVFCAEYNNEKENKKNKCIDENLELNRELDEKRSQQLKFQKEIEDATLQIENIKNWFEEQGVNLNNYTEEEWTDYVGNIQRRRIDLKAQAVELENNKKNIEALKRKRVDSNNLRAQEIEAIVKDSQLYRYIVFLQNSMNISEVAQENNVLNEKITRLESEKKKAEEVLNQNKEYSFVEEQEERKRIIQYEEKLNRLNELKETSGIFAVFSPEGIEESIKIWQNKIINYKQQKELLLQMSEDNGARFYFEKNRTIINKEADIKGQLSVMRQEEEKLSNEFNKEKINFENSLKDYFSQALINSIYQKIEPHNIMKNISYHISINEKDEPQLFIEALSAENEDDYRPEAYFSTAQLNTVAFSSFFGRALTAKDTQINTICIDDPIGHFDDMNILGFTDMIRCILETQNCQIIMSTHDKKIYEIMQRKLNNQYYNTSFIRLDNSEKVSWIHD